MVFDPIAALISNGSGSGILAVVHKGLLSESVETFVMNLLQLASATLLAGFLPASSAGTSYLPLTKVKMTYDAAEKACRRENGRLSLGTADAMRHLHHTHKSAWVERMCIDHHDLPADVSVYYRNGRRCCKATKSKEECSRQLCERAVAAPLCVLKKTARKQQEEC